MSTQQADLLTSEITRYPQGVWSHGPAGVPAVAEAPRLA